MLYNCSVQYSIFDKHNRGNNTREIINLLMRKIAFFLYRRGYKMKLMFFMRDGTPHKIRVFYFIIGISTVYNEWCYTRANVSRRGSVKYYSKFQIFINQQYKCDQIFSLSFCVISFKVILQDEIYTWGHISNQCKSWIEI